MKIKMKLNLTLKPILDLILDCIGILLLIMVLMKLSTGDNGDDEVANYILLNRPIS